MDEVQCVALSSGEIADTFPRGARMTDTQIWAAVLIFLGTYVVIAFSRAPYMDLDRPGAAVCGAVLMVACGVLSFDEAWAAIDARTIVLLLGMMILNVLLEESGFFEAAATVVLSRATSGSKLMVGLIVLSAVLSALFLNDTVCLMLTVPVLSIVRRAGLPSVPYLIALAMSANIGSVMTEIGNPQNMLIGNYSGWSYGGFVLWMAPAGAVCLAALVAILLWIYGPRLKTAKAIDHVPVPEAPVDVVLLKKTLTVILAVMVGFVAIGDLPLVAMGGAVALLVISRRTPTEVLGRVDWVLLAFFAGLFIVVHALDKTGLVADAASAIQPMYGRSLATQVPVFSAVTVVASNIVSNVPFVVLAREIVPNLMEPDLMWLVLSLSSTLAGNLTIPGSVATLIVLETARRYDPRPEGRVGFFEFLRVGSVVTLVTVVLGTLVLLAEHELVRQLGR
jgi:Na+/H+ antiporter NhaD/arsenite permease-like protein